MKQDVTLTGGDSRPVQRRRVNKGWTTARRAQFLDHVAATCNVREATEVVGLSQTSLYALRRRDPAFAEQWRMALLAGYDRLEAELLRKSIAMLDGVPIGDPDKVVGGPVTVEQAIRLLDRHRAMVKGDGVERRAPMLRATQAETDAMLLNRLRTIKRQRERKA